MRIVVRAFYRRHVVSRLGPISVIAFVVGSILTFVGPQDLLLADKALWSWGLLALGYAAGIGYVLQLRAKVAEIQESVPSLTLRRAFVEGRSLSWRVPAGMEHSLGSFDALISGSQGAAMGTAFQTGSEGREVVEQPIFCFAEFANDSAVEARNVAASVNFTADNMDQPLHMIGRWTEPEDADLQVATFHPNGIPQTLDLAFKGTGELYAWAYNNESRRFVPSTWRMPSRQLSPGTYRVEVRLRTGLMDQTFAFRLDNPGAGADLEFSVLDQSSNAAIS